MRTNKIFALEAKFINDFWRILRHKITIEGKMLTLTSKLTEKDWIEKLFMKIACEFELVDLLVGWPRDQPYALAAAWNNQCIYSDTVLNIHLP